MKRKKYVAGGFTVFFTGILLFTGIIMMNSRAYIVTGNKTSACYVVYGTPEYKMQNGTTIKLEIPMQKCMIVNDCNEEVVVEKIIYGYSGNAKDMFVEPNGTLITKTMSMDYLFDQRPPRSITTKNSRSEVRYWLRMRADYDNEYGKLERIRELLNKKKSQTN
jgi:hypothetical protein